jgi:phosphoribosylamine--glycine ligase
MQPAQDFKRAYDDDEGPNTGGMGSYSPLPWLPADVVETVMAEVVCPTLSVMRDRGTPFAGLLYVGLALTSRGPKVVEFNARFGDPETEALLPLLETPLAQVLYAAATGTLASVGELDWHPGGSVGVVLASEGYPGTPVKGQTILLPPDTKHAHIIHAGTAINEAGVLVSNGGRVLVVVGQGADLDAALSHAYAMVAQVDFPHSFHRSDIAAPARLAELANRY